MLSPMMECEPRVWLPSFILNDKEMPGIRKMTVGKEYEVKVKLRMTGYNENKGLTKEVNRCRADFDIVAIDDVDEDKK